MAWTWTPPCVSRDSFPEHVWYVFVRTSPLVRRSRHVTRGWVVEIARGDISTPPIAPAAIRLVHGIRRPSRIDVELPRVRPTRGSKFDGPCGLFTVHTRSTAVPRISGDRPGTSTSCPSHSLPFSASPPALIRKNSEPTLPHLTRTELTPQSPGALPPPPQTDPLPLLHPLRGVPIPSLPWVPGTVPPSTEGGGVCFVLLGFVSL
eukprot:scaffold1501_cov352-Pavlova_lutheri.AAC.24